MGRSFYGPYRCIGIKGLVFLKHRTLDGMYLYVFMVSAMAIPSSYPSQLGNNDYCSDIYVPFSAPFDYERRLAALQRVGECISIP